MKKFFKIVLSILIILVLVAGSGIFYITRGLDSGKKMVINKVDVSSLADGMYNGKYVAGRFSNEVNVTVENRKITKIDVVKDVTFSSPEGKTELIDKVIEKQNTDVDIVSGATITSKSYLKSIENALNK